MGQQIQVAQSLKDEAAINEILVAKFDLLSLPWILESSEPVPKPPGGYDVETAILFGRQFERLILDHVGEVYERDGSYRVDPLLGIFIEWTRTERLKRRGFVGGRYYLDTSSLKEAAHRPGRIWTEAAAQIKSVMSFILRHIKRTYPKKSDERFPIYAGPDLVERINHKEAILYYANEKTKVKLSRGSKSSKGSKGVRPNGT